MTREAGGGGGAYRQTYYPAEGRESGGPLQTPHVQTSDGGSTADFHSGDQTTAPRGRNKAKHSRANKIGALVRAKSRIELGSAACKREGWTNFKVLFNPVTMISTYRWGGGNDEGGGLFQVKYSVIIKIIEGLLFLHETCVFVVIFH